MRWLWYQFACGLKRKDEIPCQTYFPCLFINSGGSGKAGETFGGVRNSELGLGRVRVFGVKVVHKIFLWLRLYACEVSGVCVEGEEREGKPWASFAYSLQKVEKFNHDTVREKWRELKTYCCCFLSRSWRRGEGIGGSWDWERKRSLGRDRPPFLSPFPNLLNTWRVD